MSKRAFANSMNRVSIHNIMSEKPTIYRRKTKIDLFVEEYFKNGYNATQAALKVFNCSSRQSAQALGSYYLKQAKPMIRLSMEENGLTFDYLIELIVKRMEITNNKDFVALWERLVKIGNYEFL